MRVIGLSELQGVSKALERLLQLEREIVKEEARENRRTLNSNHFLWPYKSIFQLTRYKQRIKWSIGSETKKFFRFRVRRFSSDKTVQLATSHDLTHSSYTSGVLYSRWLSTICFLAIKTKHHHRLVWSSSELTVSSSVVIDFGGKTPHMASQGWKQSSYCSFGKRPSSAPL